VRLLQLRYISMESSPDAGLLQKMRTVAWVVCAQVDLCIWLPAFSRTPRSGSFSAMGWLRFSPKKEEAILHSLRDLSRCGPDWWAPTVKCAWNAID